MVFILASWVVVSALPGDASAQQAQDVVYLKNGSIIRGMIIEQVPGQSLKIRTQDGNVFVYTMAEVQRITKEESVASRPQSMSDVYSTDKSLLGINPLGFAIGGISWITFERHLQGGFAYQARFDIIGYDYEEIDGNYSYKETGSGFGGGFSIRGYTLGNAPFSGLFGGFGIDFAFTKWEWTEFDFGPYAGSGSTTVFVFSTQVGYSIAASSVRIDPSFLVGYFAGKEGDKGFTGIAFMPALQIGVVF